MRKNYFFLIVLLFASHLLFSQTAPAITTQKSFGGKSSDEARIVIRTPDKGYIVAANTSSASLPGFHGGTDFWIKKFNKKNKVEWSKCYGGSLAEYIRAIEVTTDKGYIISGSTTSNDGDVSGNHGIGYDVWIVKIDSIGNIQWSKCYGGSDYEDEAHIIQTDDGGYIFAATSGSLDGDLTNVPSHGWDDIWVAKISPTGTIEWQKKYGGTEGNFAGSIKKVTGGTGYIIGGGTYSALPGKHGDGSTQDAYVLRIDNAGTILWQKCYGGFSEEGYAFIKNTPDGGFIFVTSATSNDGDVTGVHSPYEDEFIVYDVWLVKVSSTGAIEWQKTFGGYDNDYGQDVQKTSDGGYIVCGSANSTDGDVSGNHGGADAWLIKTSANGTMQWQLCAGGSLSESANSISSDFNNGSFIFVGSNASSDGDCTNNHGSNDFWVVQLAPVATATFVTANDISTGKLLENKISVYPNPVQQTAYINLLASKAGNCIVTLTDINGKQLIKKNYNISVGQNILKLDIEKLLKGVYLVKVQQQNIALGSLKVIKN